MVVLSSIYINITYQTPGDSKMRKYMIFALFAVLMFTACTKIEELDLNNQLRPSDNDGGGQMEETPKEPEDYNVKINPADFGPDLTNPFFNMPPGKKMIYEGETEDGTERIEYYVLDEVKVVMGVEARVIWDRVWLDSMLIEETWDYYAQDKDGNVWYFGEETYEIYDGEIQNTHGAWNAGEDGALPGVYMKASPKVSDSYYQEYYKGVAEDRADVLSLTEPVAVPYGSFQNCLITRDYTFLDPGADEHKFYCKEAGGTVLEVGIEDGERIELLSVEFDAQPSKETVKDPKTLVKVLDEPKTSYVTEEEAINLALAEVPGEVTDVAKETKFGKKCYAVEIQPEDSGAETDIFIEIATGEIVAVED
jgi:uncharacterized membrane protein YkoI